MRLQVQLVHADPGVRVVLVSAWSGADCLGSALGEASDAEEAERRAELRLRQRLQADLQAPAAAPTDVAPAAQAVTDAVPAVVARRLPVAVKPAEASPGRSPGVPAPSSETIDQPELPVSQEPLGISAPPVPRPQASRPAAMAPALAREPVPMADPQVEPSPDPEDWSDDLARIDLELLRLGWSRSQEATYLERAFGHPSRSRLTRYGDLIAYLQSLAGLEAGSDPAQVALPLRRRDLLEQCDELLARLGWEPDQGRLFLELHFQCSSRQHLSDQQLLQFNMLLEEQWLQQASAPPA